MARIFISHSHKDEVEAIALSDWLISQGWGGEDDIFLDLDPKRGLVGGERWEEALRRNVRRCEAIVFVVTPDWCKSKWCFSELQQAKNLNKPIFGIIAKPIELSNIPIEMTAEWQLVDLTRAGKQEDFNVTAVSEGKAHKVTFNASELTRLKAGLENTGIDPSYFEWPPEGEPNRAPYQGLRAMQSQDAGIFFGRDGQILEGLDRLRGLHDAPPPRMLVILGASGAGKSSYMRAGLLPRLKRDDRHFVVLDSIRPGDNVLSGETGFVNALKHTLETHDIAASPRRIKQAIGEALENDSDPSSLYELLERLASSHVDDTSTALPSIVIPVDQAEELYFNQDESGASEAKQFRQLLSLLAHDERLNIILLLTIRSDSYQHMQLDTVLGGIEHQTLSLPPIAQGSYSQIILGPVQRLTMNSDRKLAIEEKLVERLLHDIAQGGAKDALPLLAFTLERLYSEYLEGDTLTLQDYEDMGGIRGSIEAAVEQAFKTADQRGDANIPMEKQARLALLKRGLIPYLASIDPEHNGAVRRVAPLSSIPQEARPIMELLVEQRLLATDTRPELDDKDEPTGKLETTIEPAHEALLRQWGQLGEWLEEDREALSALDGVKRAVIEWDANDKGDAFLAHTAGRLESAEQVANDERFHDYLKQRDRNYLAACRKADNERRNKALEQQKKITRRTRLGLVVASMLMLIAGGIGLYAFQQKQVAEKQKVALAISLDQVNLNQSKFLRSSALSAMSEGNYDEARSLMKEAWDKIGGTYDPKNPWSDYLAAAQRRLEFNDPFLMTLEGHEHPVISAQFSPDGKTIVTASSDGTARIWHAETGEEIGVLKGDEGAVTMAQFSPDGSLIVTNLHDGSPGVWSAKTGKKIAIPEGHTDTVTSIQFSPDGKMLVTTSNDKTAIVWNTTTRDEIAVLRGHADIVTSAQFSPDGMMIVTGSWDGTIRVWNTISGEEIVALGEEETLALGEHESPVSFAKFSPDGKHVITSLDGKPPILWDIKTGKEIAVFGENEGVITSIQINPDGQSIITLSSEENAKLWNLETGKEISAPEGYGSDLTSAQYSPDGKSIITTSRDKTARVWDVKTGRQIVALIGHEDSIRSAQFSPDGKKIVTASYDETAKLWNIKSTTKTLSLDGFDNSEDYEFFQFSPDGKKVVTVTSDIVTIPDDVLAIVWNVKTGEKITTFEGHKERIHTAQFSPDGKTIVTASADNTARVWDTNKGDEITTLVGHQDEVYFAHFNTDGENILTGSSDKTAKLWNADSGEMLTTLEGHESSIAFAELSPDGKSIVTASYDGYAGIWNAVTGELTAVIEGHKNTVHSAKFSSDGKTIVTASTDNTALISNADTGEVIVKLKGHEYRIASAQFSADNETIVTISGDGTARLWRVETGENIAILNYHGLNSFDYPFNEDGSTLITFDIKDNIILWDTKTGEEIYTLELGEKEKPILAKFIPSSDSAFESVIVLSSTGVIRTWELPKLKNEDLAKMNEPN